MPREATGGIRRIASGFEARITIQGDDRRGYALHYLPTQEAEARSRCVAMSELAARLRRAKQADKTHDLMTMAAEARRAEQWSAIVAAVDALCGGQAEPESSAPAWVDFADDWTSGKLNKRFPDHVPLKDSTRDAGIIRRRIEPVIGRLRVDQFTLTHAEQIMAALPNDLESSTRRHVAQVISRVCNLAVYPGRHVAASPIPKGWLPKVKDAKAKDFPFPSEDAALMRATDVPLLRRLLFGFLAREGCRVSEATALRWRDFDLEHGLVNLDENKTDDPRRWALGRDVVRALKAWRERYQKDSEPDDHVFSDACVPLVHQNGIAKVLRADLKRAGVERPSLFAASASRLRVRVHDLRALFVTHALAHGRSETWVTDRTGHTSSQMLQKYRRSARQWVEGKLGTLLPLDVAIPELASGRPPSDDDAPGSDSPHDPSARPTTTRARRGRPRRGGAPAGRTTELQRGSAHEPGSGQEAERALHRPSSRAISDATSPQDLAPSDIVEADPGFLISWSQVRVLPGVRFMPDSCPLDEVEAVLARALDGAARAERWDVVAQLARELEARRLAASGNVVALDVKRGGGT